MDKNPCQSPESDVSAEKQPEPSRELLRRRSEAFWSGLMVMGGFVLLQAVTVEILWPTAGARYLLPMRVMMLALYAVLAFPIGVLAGRWTWRASNSKWAFLVAWCVGMGTVLLALVLGAVFLWSY